MDGKRRIIAVIPAHNEQKYIFEVVKETLRYVDEVIVVNDSSSDKTQELAEKAGAIVLNHDGKLGLGSSLRTGCDAALAMNARIMLNLDGDAQHDPSEINLLISRLKKENARAIFGQRDFKKIPIIKKLGNIFLSWLLKKTFNIIIKDTQTGYRAFTSEAYKKIRWKSDDYSVASEILINLEKNKIKYTSIPIKTIYHEKHKGANIGSGIKIASMILKSRFSEK